MKTVEQVHAELIAERAALRRAVLELLAQGPQYSASICDGLGQPRPGNISRAYLLLRELEREGLCAFEGESVAFPARRYFVITDAGREALR